MCFKAMRLMDEKLVRFYIFHFPFNMLYCFYCSQIEVPTGSSTFTSMYMAKESRSLEMDLLSGTPRIKCNQVCLFINQYEIVVVQ